MIGKFPIHNKLLRCLSALDPKVQGHSVNHAALKHLREYFPTTQTGDQDDYLKEISRIQVDPTLPHCDKHTRLDHWWAEIFKSKAYLSKVVKASLSIFTGPRIEQSFNIMNNVIDDKSNRMKIYTYATIQNVKFNLKAQKSSSLELCHREDVYKSPVDKPVVYHVQTTYGRMKRSGS